MNLTLCIMLNLKCLKTDILNALIFATLRFAYKTNIYLYTYLYMYIYFNLKYLYAHEKCARKNKNKIKDENEQRGIIIKRKPICIENAANDKQNISF